MPDFIDKINKTDASEIESILKVVLLRYSELYPDWEISTISVSKCEDRNEQLDRMITLLEKMKTLNK